MKTQISLLPSRLSFPLRPYKQIPTQPSVHPLKSCSYSSSSSRRVLSQFQSLKPRIDEFYVIHERRATDFRAPKLWKISSGFSSFSIYYLPLSPSSEERDKKRHSDQRLLCAHKYGQHLNIISSQLAPKKRSLAFCN